ncbi:hypothetical protein [Bradyrhizobium sp. URHD0069]|uniref:hypothetical protein n=1 Tax=Bradyrhizobium sp. URHD0069 TaxID=1380355 RepID=UPI0012DCD08C|nr:hypothetical protein [Bradyrhizobium sp. URHD0069]
MSTASKTLVEQFPELEAVQLAATHVRRTKARFAFYKYLRAVYRVVWRWGLSKRRKTTALAKIVGKPSRIDLQPSRVIIDATYPSLEAKMASRWTRALEYAFSRDIPPSRLVYFFKQPGGVANCARHAANTDPKTTRPEPYEFWIDG